jgi:protein-disulfide isomerase
MSDKKEEKRRIREEKQAAAKRKENLVGLLTKVGGVVIAVLVAVVFYQGLFGGPPSLPPAEIGAADHVRGAAEAPVTLTIYADFECPACSTEFQVMGRAWPRVSQQAKLVFRHYPLDIHRHAFLAARYAEAAARQGGFWEMHDALYANQDLWAGTDDATAFFDDLASDIGLDVEQLKRDAELPEIRDKILSDQRGGTRAGVRGTPSLYVNGELVNTPRNANELIALVEAAATGG